MAEMNGHEHPAAPPPATAPAPMKSKPGPLSDEDLQHNADVMVRQALAIFTSRVPSAKLSYLEWDALRQTVAQALVIGMSATQQHLIGCGMAWQAMLAPEDQVLLRRLIDEEIGRHVGDPHPPTHLLALRDRLAAGLPPAGATAAA